jgi:hypothetical protein
MKLELIRIKMVHPYVYRPDGCEFAFITGIFWDTDNHRMCISIVYDNKKSDCMPLSEIENGVCEIINSKI